MNLLHVLYVYMYSLFTIFSYIFWLLLVDNSDCSLRSCLLKEPVVPENRGEKVPLVYVNEKIRLLQTRLRDNDNEVGAGPGRSGRLRPGRQLQQVRPTSTTYSTYCQVVENFATITYH
jgi:hypothetical protein